MLFCSSLIKFVIELDPKSAGMMIAMVKTMMFLRASIERWSEETTRLYSILEQEIAHS